MKVALSVVAVIFFCSQDIRHAIHNVLDDMCNGYSTRKNKDLASIISLPSLKSCSGFYALAKMSIISSALSPACRSVVQYESLCVVFLFQSNR